MNVEPPIITKLPCFFANHFQSASRKKAQLPKPMGTPASGRSASSLAGLRRMVVHDWNPRPLCPHRDSNPHE